MDTQKKNFKKEVVIAEMINCSKKAIQAKMPEFPDIHTWGEGNNITDACPCAANTVAITIPGKMQKTISFTLPIPSAPHQISHLKLHPQLCPHLPIIPLMSPAHHPLHFQFLLVPHLDSFPAYSQSCLQVLVTALHLLKHHDNYYYSQ